jgi:hypothetical protein
MTLTMGAPRAGVLADHPGRWMGEVPPPPGVSGPALKIGVDIFKRADGSLWASFASPDQKLYHAPVRKVTDADEAEVDFSFATFTLRWKQDHFAGVYRQNGHQIPVQLRRVGEFPRLVRPQDPKAPFPYQEVELAIPSKGGVVLGATLTLPHPAAARPDVAVLVAGSGPITRDADLFGHRTFAVLADQLARQGIAVLRYDKRGVALSSGDFENHVIGDLVDDLEAVVRSLKQRPGLGRVGLIGHSEGAQVAARTAARIPSDIAFVVSMAGPALTGLQTLLVQDRLHALDHGAAPAEADRLVAYARSYYQIIIDQPEVEARMAALRAFQAALDPSLRALVQKHRMDVGTLSLHLADKPFLRTLLTDDLQAPWRKVASPVLALNGSIDRLVPPDNADAIGALLRASGNVRGRVVHLPKLNHGFQTAETGRPDEAERIAETLSPAVVPLITDFVKALGRPQ